MSANLMDIIVASGDVGMTRPFLFLLLVLWGATVHAEAFGDFEGIDDPVGKIERPFVWTSKNTPAPWNGLPYNFSIADKFHGYLYFNVDRNTGIGYSDLHFKNDYRTRGFTACANVFYRGPGRSYNARVLAGVNPDSTRDNLRVSIDQSPEFWSGIQSITIAFGWCPSGGAFKKLVRFFESIEVPPSIKSSGSAPPTSSDPKLTALYIVTQNCAWPGADGKLDGAMRGGVDFQIWGEDCESARAIAQSRADAEGCGALGSNWVRTYQAHTITDTCR